MSTVPLIAPAMAPVRAGEITSATGRGEQRRNRKGEIGAEVRSRSYPCPPACQPPTNSSAVIAARTVSQRPSPRLLTGWRVARIRRQAASASSSRGIAGTTSAHPASAPTASSAPREKGSAASEQQFGMDRLVDRRSHQLGSRLPCWRSHSSYGAQWLGSSRRLCGRSSSAGHRGARSDDGEDFDLPMPALLGQEITRHCVRTNRRGRLPSGAQARRWSIEHDPDEAINMSAVLSMASGMVPRRSNQRRNMR